MPFQTELDLAQTCVYARSNNLRPSAFCLLSSQLIFPDSRHDLTSTYDIKGDEYQLKIRKRGTDDQSGVIAEIGVFPLARGGEKPNV